MDFGSLLRKKPKKVSSPETFQLEQLTPLQTHQTQQSHKRPAPAAAHLHCHHQRQRPYSSSCSNLSTCSSIGSSCTTNSSSTTSLSRKSIYITLPQNLGIEIDSNTGKVFNIIKGSVAHGSGVIQLGDYIQVIEKDEAEELISLRVTFGILHIEQRPTYPFVIEIGNRSQTSLGIALSDSPAGNKIRISSILPGSLVDRCGFIHAGDYLTSIYINPNEIITCSPYYTSQQIAKLLRKIVQQQNTTSIILTIFPCLTTTASLCNNSSINGSYKTLVDHNNDDDRNEEAEEEEEEVDDNSSSSEISNFTLTNEEQQPFLIENDLRRLDFPIDSSSNSTSTQSILNICLWKDFLYEDWGFSLIDDEKHKENDNPLSSSVKYHKNNGTLVNEIRNGGSAEVSGLKTGDKILQVNGRDVSNLKSTMIVPILASLEDALNLLILRNN